MLVLPPSIVPGATLAHVGVAVRSIADALGFYRDVLGGAASAPELADGATVVSVTCGPAQVELLEVARGKTIGHMDQYDGRAALACQRAHVRDDHAVRARVLERDEDALIH